MHYLKCSLCGCLNEIKTPYLVFCSSCNKKLINNFSDWHKRNPESTLEDYKKQICISEEEIQVSNIKEKRYPKSLKLLIFIGVIIAVFVTAGSLAGERIMNLFVRSVMNKAMIEYANELNKNCPIMVDNVTRLDNGIALPGNVFQYNYTILTEMNH